MGQLHQLLQTTADGKYDKYLGRRLCRRNVREGVEVRKLLILRSKRDW